MLLANKRLQDSNQILARKTIDVALKSNFREKKNFWERAFSHGDL